VAVVIEPTVVACELGEVVATAIGRRKKAQYLPSKVGTMLTTSQPSADFLVNSVARASGLEL
jgi:hypothetical protein